MSQTALKYNEGKVQLSLITPAFLHDLARVREFGAAKYAPWDWVHGRAWTDYYDAAQRHLNQWLSGEDLDPESRLPHLAHAACNLMFLSEFARSGRGVDNRPIGMIESLLPAEVK